jgi:hypothetical protein
MRYTVNKNIMNYKKTLLILSVLLLLPLIVLAACKKDAPPPIEDRFAEENPDRVYTLEGTIEPLESIDIYQPGTHRIVTDSDTVFIQSASIDLNRYLDEPVIISGKNAKLLGEAERVINVTSVEFIDPSLNEDLEDYLNKAQGLSFTYPASWELEEEDDRIMLSFEESEIADIQVHSSDSDIESFVREQESGLGTEVTIGAQRAFRYLTGEGPRFYVVNPPKEKIYQIDYMPLDDESLKAEQVEEAFYDLLESIKLVYLSAYQGAECGGLRRIECGEGYRCELEDASKYAEGICVPIDGVSPESNCPYIAPPRGCQTYRISEYNKNGCPARYECIEEESSLKAESAEVTFDTANLIATIEKYRDSILNEEGAELKRYEINFGENLVSVIYEADGQIFKNLLEYSPAANEFNFIEKARFEQLNGDWRLLSGEDLMEGKIDQVKEAGVKEVSEPEVSEPEEVEEQEDKMSDAMQEGQDEDSDSAPPADYEVPETEEVSGYYENSRRGFSLNYPKTWYYASFGALDDAGWVVGFSSEALDLETPEKSLITVSIYDEKPSPESGNYQTSKTVDDTLFVIEGPSELKAVMDEMIGTIQLIGE